MFYISIYYHGDKETKETYINTFVCEIYRGGITWSGALKQITFL